MRFMLLGKRVFLIFILALLGLGNLKVFAMEENHLFLKTNPELYQQISNLKDDELIDVYIWKQSIEEETYKTELLSHGFDETIYGDEEVFQKNIVSNLPVFGKNIRIKDIRDEYNTARLKAIKSVSIESNQKFLIDNNLENNNLIYLSSYTSTIIVSLTKSDILKVVEDDRTLGLSLYENEVFKNATNISVDQINAGYASNGLKNDLQGGYDGSGVKIGIIEAESGRFDPNSPMLSSLVNTGQLEFIEVDRVSEDISNHATHVTNIIVGLPYNYLNMFQFEGIATGAKVYQSGIVNNIDLYLAFSQFIELEVDIINFSGGFSPLSYNAIDQEIDNLIYTSKVLFVVSSGNDSANVASPGKAYNAITVGSVDTKSSVLEGESDAFEISSFSNYSVNSYLSNKPEIVAPGKLIMSMIEPYEPGELPYWNSGTSFAAPHVTGVLAQLIEKYGSTINNNNYITYFKGRLMLGANSSTETVDDISHRTGDSSIFYNKQGAGLVDATNSATQIYGWNKYIRKFTIPLNDYVYIFTPPSDYSIRAVLIFEKPENMGITSNYGNNLDLYLESPGGYVFASSTSTTNTHEMLEYTIPANQSILLRINRVSYILGSPYISISCFWIGV